MAFTVPEFPLTCNICTGPWLTRVLRISPSCNLAMGRRTAFLDFPIDIIDSTQGLSPNLLLPPLTDVRDVACSGSGLADVVECPAGSARWYQVVNVDDVAKGFANEYRLASLIKIYQGLDSIRFAGLFWPTPIP